ncbi:MAG: alpha/beta hydrolase, partial [Aquabacterium sp.]|nr:alpha/beta hydrolase [Aquabacterium sp.]
MPAAGPGARFAALPADADDGQVLVRPALRQPARWRALILPGSGCESLAPSADRLARSLRQAQVVLLQKPALSAPGQPCSPANLLADNLADWQQRALRLAAQGLASTDAQLPLVLVGLSEGAELLPGLAAARPEAVALVLVGHAGLDPAE